MDNDIVGGRSQEEMNEINNALANQRQSLSNDSGYDSITRWVLKNGYSMSDETLDYLYNQFFTEKNNNTAWQRTLDADNTKYQRMVADMKKAGLNPFVSLNGSPSSVNAPTGSVGSGSLASIKNQSKQSRTQLFGNLISAIASLGGALIMGMLVAH